MLNKFAEVDYKCFRQFKWGELPELARFNLFYGWNGTGKTTLANLLADLERNATVEEGKVVFRINDMNVQGDQVGQSGQPLPRFRVFNQRYVENSVLSRFNSLEHIVFFGERNVEHEQQRKTAVEELNKLREAWQELSQKKSKAANDFDAYKKEQALAIKTLLRTSGKDSYTNYDKSNFEARCDSFDPKRDRTINEDEKTALVATIRTDIRPVLSIQKIINPVSSSMPEDIRQVLATSPSSVAIEGLKEDARLAEWVGQGLQLHRHRESRTCLFCENTLGEDRVKRLEQHFDDSFRILNGKLADLLQSVQKLKTITSDLKSYPVTSVYPQLVDRLKVLNTALEKKKAELLTVLLAVETNLKAKLDNIFSTMKVPAALSDLLSKGEALTESANEIQLLLAEHNRITNDFSGQVSQAKANLEADFIASSIASYAEKKRQARSTTEDLEQNVRKTGEVEAVIRRLDEDLTETVAPAEDLNRDLALYLGHDELQLAHHGKGYTITRGHEEARDLSEGEKTAFALLYFLKTLEDHRSKLEDTIVVIDDPVSSLDSSAMFTAFGFIKERTEKARQIIVLTHDFSFFNLVKNWFRYVPDSRNVTRYYSLASVMGDDGKRNVILVLDKLLKDYASEYQYLFHLVKKGATAQGQELSELYGLPNVGRRLIEHFIAFKFPGGKGKEELFERMKKLGLDSKTLAVLNRFLNVHSHGDGVAAAEHDLSLLSETQKVMQAILDAMRAEDKEHVERLEAVVQR